MCQIHVIYGSNAKVMRATTWIHGTGTEAAPIGGLTPRSSTGAGLYVKFLKNAKNCVYKPTPKPN